MLKRYSSLDPIYAAGIFTNNKNISISLKENVNINLKQIVCWSNTIIQTEDFLKKELDLNKVPSFNKGIINEKYSIWRMEPLKWWLLNKELNLPNELGTNLDLSHAFTSISVSGESSSVLLNRFLPIDLRDKVFPKASSSSSSLHHVSIKLLKYNKNDYKIFIPRGFALSIWEILVESPKQFGYEILER